MAEIFYRKKNDRELGISVICYDDAGAVSLTGATATFSMKNVSTGTVKVSAGACSLGATTGQVTYSWASGDTDTVGKYYGEFRVTFGDGKKATFPSAPEPYFIVYIQEVLE